MESIVKDQLNKLKHKEWSVLFIHADGCKYCEAAKPRVQVYSERYPEIQFLSASLMEVYEYYNKFAEKEQEVLYEQVPDSEDTIAVPQFNEDGTPKMIIRYSIPFLMVHHSKAATAENEYGYVGGYSDTSDGEMSLICEQILRFGNHVNS